MDPAPRWARVRACGVTRSILAARARFCALLRPSVLLFQWNMQLDTAALVPMDYGSIDGSDDGWDSRTDAPSDSSDAFAAPAVLQSPAGSTGGSFLEAVVPAELQPVCCPALANIFSVWDVYPVQGICSLQDAILIEVGLLGQCTEAVREAAT